MAKKAVTKAVGKPFVAKAGPMTAKEGTMPIPEEMMMAGKTPPPGMMAKVEPKGKTAPKAKKK